MVEVALAEEPLEVAVGGVADVFGEKRGLFVAVAAGVGFVALDAVVEVELPAGGDGVGISGERIHAGMVPGRDVVEVRMRVGGSEGGTGDESGGYSKGRAARQIRERAGDPLLDDGTPSLSA